MNNIFWHGTIKLGEHALLFFLWYGRNSWRWPQIEQLSPHEWRYKIGPFDGKYRSRRAGRTQLWMDQ